MDESTGALIVCVSDEKEGAYFELHPPPELALDAFNHPYAYADRADLYLVDVRLSLTSQLVAAIAAPQRKFTEPVALLSTRPVDVPCPRTASG